MKDAGTATITIIYKFACILPPFYLPANRVYDNIEILTL